MGLVAFLAGIFQYFPGFVMVVDDVELDLTLLRECRDEFIVGKK